MYTVIYKMEFHLRAWINNRCSKLKMSFTKDRSRSSPIPSCIVRIHRKGDDIGTYTFAIITQVKDYANSSLFLSLSLSLSFSLFLSLFIGCWMGKSQNG